MHAAGEFRVAFTGDFVSRSGTPLYRDYGVGVLEAQPGLRITSFAEHRGEIDPQQIGDSQAVVVLSPKVSAHSLSQSENLLAIGRFGVGFDSVDVLACTAADVILMTAVGAVDRSVAEATLGLDAGTDASGADQRPSGARGSLARPQRLHGTRTARSITGHRRHGGHRAALVELVRGFGMGEVIAFDPYLDPKVALGAGGNPGRTRRIDASGRFRIHSLPVEPRHAKPDRAGNWP